MPTDRHDTIGCKSEILRFDQNLQLLSIYIEWQIMVSRPKIVVEHHPLPPYGKIIGIEEHFMNISIVPV